MAQLVEVYDILLLRWIVVDSMGFADYFSELPDPRLDRRKRHSRMDILFIAVCAVICGATSFVDMADFGKAKIDWFKERLELEYGIPSQESSKNVSVRRKINKAGWDNSFLARIVAGF